MMPAGYFLMRSHLERHPAGRAILSPFDVIFSSFDVVEPNLLYLSHARENALQEHGLTAIRVYRKAGGRFDTAIELSLDRGDVLTTPLLPALRMRLADVFKK